MKHKHQCNRCGKIIPRKKVFYRYPAIKDIPSNSCDNIIYSTLLTFCDKCVRIFDNNNKTMRSKYLYKDNEKLKHFYLQYEDNNHAR
jgi:hypothetical protein